MAIREATINQPEEFTISADTLKQAKNIIAKYPVGKQRSAVMPMLDLVQRQAGGWLPIAAMQAVGDLLDMPYMKVYEVASFFTLYNLKPVGKRLVQVCRTTPCWLRGSDDITKACKDKLGIDIGCTSEDGEFTLVEVECLGACVNAPMVQINDDFYEDLTPAIMDKILNDLSSGIDVKIGTQIDRHHSAPVGYKG